LLIAMKFRFLPPHARNVHGARPLQSRRDRETIMDEMSMRPFETKVRADQRALAKAACRMLRADPRLAA
jgi:hypothetical protein